MCLFRSLGLSPRFASLAFGVGQVLRPTIVSKFGCRFGFHADSGVIVADIAVLALGVGHNNNSVSAVIGSHGCCRNNTPLRVIPDTGKFTNNGQSPHREMSPNIFQDCVSRS